MTHDQIKDALPAFALDALDPSERAVVEEHLRECDECQAELVALYRVTDGIGLEAPPVAPPASLKARVVAGATAAGRGPAATRQAPRRSWVMPVALAASLVLAAGAVYYGYRLQLEAEPLRQMERVLAAADLVRADLKGQDVAAGATGRAMWSASAGFVFTANQLPELGRGRVYQLWAIRGTTATSAGLLTRKDDGSVLFISPAAAEGREGIGAREAVPDAFGVTIEPAGGSQSPTLPIVMIGSIAR